MKNFSRPRVHNDGGLIAPEKYSLRMCMLFGTKINSADRLVDSRTPKSIATCGAQQVSEQDRFTQVFLDDALGDDPCDLRP